MKSIFNSVLGRMPTLSTSLLLFLLIFSLFNAFLAPVRAEHGDTQAHVGMRVSDNQCRNQIGLPRYSTDGAWSGWAYDTNAFDPDCFQIYMSSNPDFLNKDIQICIQISDKGLGRNTGPVQCSPWSSEGGGWSAWAHDSNAYDPDSINIMLKTRPLDGKRINDLRLGLQVNDNGCRNQTGEAMFTPWQSTGGGWSGWASDTNQYDPDCVRVNVTADVSTVIDVCGNIDGEQNTLPAGYYYDANGDCVIPTITTVADVCPNIPGDQAVLPANHYINAASQCVVPVCPADEPVEEIVETITSDSGATSSTCPNLRSDRRLVRSGETVTINWCADEVTTNSCVVTGNNGDRWTGVVGSERSQPITSSAVYQLSCDGRVLRTMRINMQATVQET